MAQSAPEKSPSSLETELRSVSDDLLGLPRSGARRLRRGNRGALAVAALWLAAIVLDAATTLYMGAHGYEEANPAAAGLMRVIGAPAAVLLISLWCVALAIVACGRPRTLSGWVAVSGLIAVGVVKLLVAVSNVILYLSGVDLL